MAADFRLVVHTAKSDAHEFAPQRTRDGLAKRRLAHARRAHEAKNRSLHSRLKLLHRQVIEDALFHLLQIVVVFIENLVRLHDVDFRAARGLAPRQRSHPFQICPRNHVLRGSRSHFRQPLELAFALFLGFRGHAGFFHFFPEFVDLLHRIVRFAKFLLNCLHLLTQQVLALVLAHLFLHLLVDFRAQLQNLEFLREFADQRFQPLAHAGGFY